MNVDHEFAVSDWNYASAQDTKGQSEVKSIDDDFPTFEIDQNEPVALGSFPSRALTLQGPVIDFYQSADLTKYSTYKIVKFFFPDTNPRCKPVKER